MQHAWMLTLAAAASAAVCSAVCPSAHFDRSLTKKKGAYDEKTDAEKIKGRVANAQEMTNQYYDLATEFYEYGQAHSRAHGPRPAAWRWRVAPFLRPARRFES